MYADKISDAEVTEKQVKEEKNTDQDAYFVDEQYSQIDVLKTLLEKVKGSADSDLHKDLYSARKSLAEHMEQLMEDDVFSVEFVLCIMTYAHR